MNNYSEDAPDTVRSFVSFDEVPPSSKVKCKAKVKGKNKPVRYCFDNEGMCLTSRDMQEVCREKALPKGITLGALIRMKMSEFANAS